MKSNLWEYCGDCGIHINPNSMCGKEKWDKVQMSGVSQNTFLSKNLNAVHIFQ